MATWQFNIELIPKKWVEDSNFDVAKLYDEEGHDTSLAWQDNQPKKNYEEVLSAVLSKGKSWSENLSLWGNEKTNDIQVWHEDNKIDCITVRLDLRENISSILVKVVNATIDLDCMLFIPNQKVIIEPNLTVLEEVAIKSSAAKFVKDPKKFIENIEEKHNH